MNECKVIGIKATSQGKEGEAASVTLGSDRHPWCTHADKTDRQAARGDGRTRMSDSGDGHQGSRRPLLVTRNRESLSICEDNQMTS